MLVTKRGQGATEFVIILAVALIVLTIIFQINGDVITSVTSEYRHTKAKAALDDIGDAAEQVYQQGSGSKSKLYLSLPNNIQNITASNQTLSISFFGVQDSIYRSFGFPISGNLPVDEGFYWITVEAFDSQVVVNSTGILSVESPAAVCGNMIKEGGEQCDGTDLGGQTCTGLGFDSGNLLCTVICNYDTSQCLNDTSPPAAVTNLFSPSQGTSWIYWTWTNPADIDFSQSIILLNGSNIANITGSVFNATGLDEDKNYTISIHTKDLTGNVNTLDVNNTNKTKKSVPITVEQEIFYDGFEGWEGTECGHLGKWTQCSQGDGHIVRSNDVYNGTLSVRFNDHDNDVNFLIKCVDLSSFTSAELEFVWKKDGLDTGEYGKLDINGSSIPYTEIFDSGQGSSSYTKQRIDISQFISSETCIRFHALANVGADRFFLEDVRITAKP
jgi:hypothetical protein